MTGDRMLRVARAWFADDIVARVFEPLVADWQIEHAALRGRARLGSRLRIWICFAMTAALMLPWQLQQRLPERVTLGGWIVTEAFVVIGVAAQWYLFFDASPRGASHLLPALLSTALPLALIPAAFVVSRLGTPVEARTMMVRLTLIVMLCLAPLLAWWLPTANQAWRVAQAGEGRFVIVAAPEIEADWNDVRRHMLIERTSVLLMPATLCLLAIAMSSAIRRQRTLAGLIMWAVTAGVWLTMLDITPWGAHAVFLDAALLFHVYDKRESALAG